MLLPSGYLFNLSIFTSVDDLSTSTSNAVDISVPNADLILTNNTTFNELKSIQNKFMKKDILDNKTKNFENVCQYLDEKNILKFQDIIKFDGNNPAFFYLTKNKNISNLAKFIQKLAKLEIFLFLVK
mgnify:CR=1 FL=1